MLSLCREGSSVPLLEAMRAPLVDIGRLGSCVFSLAAWSPPVEKERLPSTASYHEMIQNLFSGAASVLFNRHLKLYLMIYL